MELAPGVLTRRVSSSSVRPETWVLSNGGGGPLMENNTSSKHANKKAFFQFGEF